MKTEMTTEKKELHTDNIPRMVAQSIKTPPLKESLISFSGSVQGSMAMKSACLLPYQGPDIGGYFEVGLYKSK